MLPFLFAFATAAAPATIAPTDMMAHYRAGQWLCSEPDEPSKTCAAIDRLTPRPDSNPGGNIVITSEMLLAPDRPITLESRSLAHAEGAGLCSVMDLADLQTAVVRVKGQPLTPERNAPAIERLSVLFKPLAGRKGCESLSVKDGTLIKIGQIEGVPLPVIRNANWVSPQDGYKVAPRPDAQPLPPIPPAPQPNP